MLTGSQRNAELGGLAAEVLTIEIESPVLLLVVHDGADFAVVDPQRQRDWIRIRRPHAADEDLDHVLAFDRHAVNRMEGVRQAQAGDVVLAPGTCARRRCAAPRTAAASASASTSAGRRARPARRCPPPTGTSPSAPATATARRRCCRTRSRNRPAESRRPAAISTPSRSRIVLLYSVRLSRRAVTRPGSGGVTRSIRASSRSSHVATACRCASSGCSSSSGGISLRRSMPMTSSQ